MKRLSSWPASNFVQNNAEIKRRKADDTSASSSSATPKESNNYNIFLSFRGTDTRKTFVDHLYTSLVDAGISVFKDDDELCKGEKIGTNLLQAIKNSKISIPVLSQNYPSSKWCLQELVQMTECMTSARHVVLPIFHRVEPADVRHQKGSFGEAFSHLGGKYSEEDVAKWKQALQEVASLKGWESEKTANGREGELVKMVVRTILSKLKEAFQLVVTEQLVGIDNTVADILRLLDDNPSATQIVGIHGMGALEQLIWDIQGRKDEVPNSDAAIRILESRFKHKKVLILLDDVDDHYQLKALIGKHDWFERGSRIIINTRKKSILDHAEVNCQYELNETAKDQSLILFSRHAFRRNSPPCEFESLSHDVVFTTGGLPFSLEVIGLFLCGKKQSFWQDTLKRLKKVPHEDVQEKLRISYEALNHEQKQIFVDIACLFIGTDLRMASYMWDACDFYLSMGLETLRFMSIIKIGDNHDLKMHDQLRDLGREIVHQEDYNAPTNRSRLWVHEEASEVLQRNKGIEKLHIRALRLYTWGSNSEFTTGQFEKLPNLRFLQVSATKQIGDSKSLLLPKLRWLQWNGRAALVATSFRLEKLVILDLSGSDISEIWEGWSHLKVAKELKVLNLTNCWHLKVTPDLSTFQNLEMLVLASCWNLEQIHQSIGEVRCLVSLDFSECWKLQVLPEEMGKLEQLKELNLGETAIEEIPPCISSLKKLEILHAYGCKSLVGLPNSNSHLVKLSTLDLSTCISLDRLPESIGSLVKLQRLSLGKRGKKSRWVTSMNYGSNYILDKIEHLEPLACTGIRELPESIGDLKNLKILEITTCTLSNIPSALGKLGNLEELHASHCRSLGGEIPKDGLSSLKMLVLSWTGISGFPNTFDKVSRPEKLDLRNCDMLKSLPKSMSKLPSLQHLQLLNCYELQSLPELPSCLTVLEVTCRHHTLPQLSHLIHLNELTVYECKLLESMPELPSAMLKLSVYGCDKLKELPSLSSSKLLSQLDIQKCCELTEIKGLEALKSLVHLSACASAKLSKFDGLEHAYSLRYLNMSFSSVNDDVVQVPCLDRLKNLEQLDISFCEYLVRPDLSPLTHLKLLRARDCYNLVKIKGLERLTKLDCVIIENCTSIETLPDLSCFGNLKYLDTCSKLRDVHGLEKVGHLAK